MREPINSKKKLEDFIKSDRSCITWDSLSKKERILKHFTHDFQYGILRYLRYTRIEEYLEYSKPNPITKIRLITVKRKKNSLGGKLDLDLYSESFGKGLAIYHGGIIVHPSAKLGSDCRLHGHNCIGNNGKSQGVPVIGDHVDIGVGACVIGNIVIGDNVVIGANAVVNKSFQDGSSLLVGIPAAKKYKTKE